MQENPNIESQSLFDADDIKKNKILAVLAYICFIIPLIAGNKSKFARYHTNQGILLCLFFIVIFITSAIVPTIGWIVVGPLGSLLTFILEIVGIVNASKGQIKELPLFGHIRIIKI